MPHELVRAIRPLKTIDGIKIPGQRFMTLEADALVAQGSAERISKLPPPEPPPEVKVELKPAPKPAPKPVKVKKPQWPLKISPQVYLDRYPKGPKADLARQILKD